MGKKKKKEHLPDEHVDLVSDVPPAASARMVAVSTALSRAKQELEKIGDAIRAASADGHCSCTIEFSKPVGAMACRHLQAKGYSTQYGVDTKHLVISW